MAADSLLIVHPHCGGLTVRRTTIAYGRLLGDADRSPITRRNGSPSQFSGAVFVTYALF